MQIFKKEPYFAKLTPPHMRNWKQKVKRKMIPWRGWERVRQLELKGIKVEGGGVSISVAVIEKW